MSAPNERIQIRATYDAVLPFAQYIENIRGKSSDASILTGTYMDEAKAEALFHRDKNVGVNQLKLMQYLNLVRSILLYLTGKHDQAEKLRKRYSGLPVEEGTTSTNYFRNTFLALNCYELARQTKHNGQLNLLFNKARQARLLGAANEYVKEIEYMGKAGSPTSAALLQLLKDLSCQGKTSKAVEMYSESVRLLGEDRIYLLEAIACERLGLCLRDVNPQSSELALHQA